MRLGPGFSRGFFAQHCLTVAPALLGAYLVRRLEDGTRLIGRIVEVEAYTGDGSDPGSHSHRGITPRNQVMFGPPGRLYVYRSYGIHICANVVCDRAGASAAVLLRAVEPLIGVERMRALRQLPAARPEVEIANGPGKLAQAFDLRMEDYGCSVLRGPIRLHRAGPDEPRPRVSRSRRIGLTHGAELPYRFYLANNPFVGRTPPDEYPARKTRHRGHRTASSRGRAPGSPTPPGVPIRCCGCRGQRLRAQPA